MSREPRLALFVAIGSCTVGVLATLAWPSTYTRVAGSLAVVVAGATVVYALLTARLVSATAAALEAQTRPHVIVHMELVGFVIYMAIENVGAGEARTLRFRSSTSFDAFPEQMVSQTRIFSDGMALLAPRQKRMVMLANGAAAIKQDRWPSVDVTVSYCSSAKLAYESTFSLDLQDLRGFNMIDLSLPPERIADSLKEISAWVKKQ